MGIDETKELWELFARQGKNIPLTSLSEQLAQSWMRSRKQNVPVQIEALQQLSVVDVEYRCNRVPELIESALPYIHKLYKIIQDDESLITLADKDAVILETITSDSMAIMPNFPNVGTIHSEELVGTNGVGTCLASGEAIQLQGPEHWLEINHSWVCSTSPIYINSQLVGCINLSCPVAGKHHKHTLGLVIATANAIEREIMLNTVLNDRRTVLSQQDAILKIVDTGIIAIDRKGVITKINQQAMDAFAVDSVWEGKPVDDLIQTATRFTELIHDREELDDFELPVKIGGRYKHFVFSTFHMNQDKIGIGTIIRVRTSGAIRRMLTRVSGFRATYTFEDVITQSSAMDQPLKLGRLAGKNTSNVLITGESGTGKELIAQAIHNASDRKNKPFIALNCGALSRELIQSELFGYEGGAFTGANSNGNPGKFELAEGGTLFLDEIGEVPLELQVNLLRVLQTGVVLRIGAQHPINVDVRIIAATNRDLLRAVDEVSFRHDLYYRLNVLSIALPPLRERGRDVRLLAEHFLGRAVIQSNRSPMIFSDDVLTVFESYTWPGNIRELENTIQRAMLLSEGDVITIKDLPLNMTTGGTPESSEPNVELPAVLMLSTKVSERNRLIRSLQKTSGNLRQAANLMDVSRGTVYNLLKKYNLSVEDFR